MSFFQWKEPKKVRQHPAEKTIRTVYFSDYGAKAVVKTELFAYISNAIGQASDKLLSKQIRNAVMAQVWDEVTGKIAAVITMVDDYTLNTQVSHDFPPHLRSKNRR